MSDTIVGILVGVSILVCAGVCLCVTSVLNHENTHIEVTYTRNPVAAVHGSPPPDADEDPINFSSNPKSSSVSVGS
jgi:hypothetical protein